MKSIFSFFYKKKRNEMETSPTKRAEGLLAYELAKKGLGSNPQVSEKQELLDLLDIAIINGIDEAHLERGFCLHELGYDLDAILDLDEAEKLFPTHPEIFFTRGLSKRILLEIDSSIMDFENALNLAKQSKLYTNKEIIRFEIELQSTRDRRKHLENPYLKAAFLEKAGEPKRRKK